MITKIELTNFKSHAHTVIEPGRVTALVGPNGAGKSTVLQALSILIDSTDTSSSLKIDPTKKFIKETADLFELKISGIEKQSRWSLRLLSSNKEVSPLAGFPNIKLPVWGIFLEGQFNGEGGCIAPITEYGLGPSIPQSVFTAVGEYSYLKASAANLAAPSYSEEIPPSISENGTDLAPTIANLMTSESDGHQAIVESLSRIVPQVKNVRVRPVKVPRTEKRVISIDGKDFPFDEKREVVGHEIIFDTQTIKSLPASSMSDGTLLVLGLLTLLWSSPNSRLILLDDIEAGLHPLAQRQLMQVLKDFAEKHDRQIILTSHSPYIIDELAPEDVWVMNMDQEGVSHAKRLSEHPDAKRGLEVLTTGEFLSAEGEDWVIENKTPAEMVNA